MLQDLAMLVVGVVLGYFAGVVQDRRSTQYSERATAVVELRELARRTSDSFLYLAYEAQLYSSDAPGRDDPPASLEERLPDLDQKAEELKREIASMYGYYHAKSPWLASSTKERFENLASPLSHHAISLSTEIGMHRRLFKEETEIYLRSVARAREWAEGEGRDQLPALRAAFDEEVEKIVGTRPWWRRIFEG